MPSFLDLFEDLEADTSDPLLDTEALQAGLEALGQVRDACDSDDERRGEPPGCKGGGGVKVAGDPEIVDSHGRYFHYLGPALLVNFDGRGMVRSLEFVGVWGGRKNANYISEVWYYDVRTQQYKYRNLWYMQGVPAHACKDQAPSAEAYWGHSWSSSGDVEFTAGDPSWESELGADAKPPQHFLSAFKVDSETFFVNLADGTFARGPPFGMLKAVIENPVRFLKPLIKSCSKTPDVWMKEAAAAITESKQHDRKIGKVSKPIRNEQAAQVAQLVFGLAACRQPSKMFSEVEPSPEPEHDDPFFETSKVKLSTATPSMAASSTAPAASTDPWLTSDPWSGASVASSSAAPAASEDPWLNSDPWSMRSVASSSAAAPAASEDPWSTSDPWSVALASAL